MNSKVGLVTYWSRLMRVNECGVSVSTLIGFNTRPCACTKCVCVRLCACACVRIWMPAPLSPGRQWRQVGTRWALCRQSEFCRKGLLPKLAQDTDSQIDDWSGSSGRKVFHVHVSGCVCVCACVSAFSTCAWSYTCLQLHVHMSWRVYMWRWAVGMCE